MLEHGCIGIHRRVIIYQVHMICILYIYICVEREREKRETFLYSKPLNYYSAVIAFASEGYTNTKKKKNN